MHNVWFTSDTHFGHNNIIKYEHEARPFDIIEEMNEKLIDNWNSVVGKKDTVYHLGDFCFGKQHLEIAKRLKGRKILILGNHDVYKYDDYFDRVFGTLSYKSMWLTHIPVHTAELGGRAVINVHGHLHSKVIDDDRYFNVSVERHNLTPVHLDVILERRGMI